MSDSQQSSEAGGRGGHGSTDCFDTEDWNMFKEAATYNPQADTQKYTYMCVHHCPDHQMHIWYDGQTMAT